MSWSMTGPVFVVSEWSLIHPGRWLMTTELRSPKARTASIHLRYLPMATTSWPSKSLQMLLFRWIPYEIVRSKKDQVFPEGHIAPGTLIANTDTKHYQHLVSKIYRQRSLTILLHDIDIFQVHPGLYHKKWHKTVSWVQWEDLRWKLHSNHRVLPPADQECWHTGIDHLHFNYIHLSSFSRLAEKAVGVRSLRLHLLVLVNQSFVIICYHLYEWLFLMKVVFFI